MKKSPLLLIIFYLASGINLLKSQTPGNIDPSFNTADAGFGAGYGASGITYSCALQPDGKVIVGGNFTSYNFISRNRIARLNSDGSVDLTFNQGTGASGIVYACAVQNDGKIVVGGDFTNFNGSGKNYIVRLNSDGTVDGTFNIGTGANAAVFTCALQSDGKIIIGGNFTTVNGTTANRVARLNTNGSVDAAFSSGGGSNGTVYSSVIQSDGKIILGGNFTAYTGSGRNRILRLNTDGTIDFTFNPGTGAPGIIRICFIQPDGKILIGGEFLSYNGTTRTRIARVNTDGTLDTGFDPGSGANITVYTINMQSNNKVIVGGSFTIFNGVSKTNITRLNIDGSLDGTFNSGGSVNGTGYATTILNDDRIIFVGAFTLYNNISIRDIIRLNANGTQDVTFNPSTGAGDAIRTMAIQNDGKIIIGGDFNSYNGVIRSRIARLNTDGSLDASFITTGSFDGGISTCAIQTDGKIIIGGSFTTYNGFSRNRIARLNTDGSLDQSFNPGTGANRTGGTDVYTCAIQSDGKIIIGGLFTSYNIVTRNYIARINSDGSLDATFNPSPSSVVYTCLIQTNGKIIIGGDFFTYASFPRSYIARLNSDGTIDGTFNLGSGPSSTVLSCAKQTDGKILIGGFFTTYNGTSTSRIARLNSDGTLDATFNVGTGANSGINSIVVQNDGKIILAGGFVVYNGVARNYITRINSNGSIDGSFNIGTGSNNSINSCAIQNDGKILIGGTFISYDGTGKNRVARLYGGYNLIVSNINPSLAVCTGKAINVTFQPEGVFNPGNIFTVQLSNSAGIFLSPVAIGSLAGTNAGTISCQIPTGTPQGNGYRIRVVSSDTLFTGPDNGSNITINSTPVAIASSGSPFCQGNSFTLNSGGGTNYSWTGPGGYFSNVQNPLVTTASVGNSLYTVIVSGAGGCSASASVTVTVNPLLTFYADADNDGYGVTSNTIQSCFSSGVYRTLVGGDCNDSKPTVNPAATEICNNLEDDNCDGNIDEGCNVVLHLQLFIGGFYKGNGIMLATIDSVNYPLLCDTIVVELMNSTIPFNPAFSKKGTININGNGDFTFPLAVMSGSYYIRIKHRSALETWSASSIMINSFQISYSFSDAVTKAYGNNLTNFGDGNFGLWNGDIFNKNTSTGNIQDGVISIEDYSYIESVIGDVILGYVPMDLTGDNIVESADYSLIENNFYYAISTTHP